MNFTVCNDDFTVIDNVLGADQFLELWQSVQALKYDFPGSEWMRLWPLTDPQPVMSGPFSWADRPCGYGMDHYIEKFSECVLDTRSCLSNRVEWIDIAFRVFLHGRGSRMVSHSDTPKYEGAGVFYAHPVWEPTWGGEICFPSLDSELNISKISVSGESLTNSVINQAIQARGVGTYISPKPNRLVLIRGGVIHSTNRVDLDAGAALRCSVTSFLVPAKDGWNTNAKNTFSLD